MRIDYLSSPEFGRGGQILIPHGKWTSAGGHTLDAYRMSISIEGVGYNHNPEHWGTEIRLSSKPNANYMFRVLADNHKTSLKNLTVNMRGVTDSVGLLITDHDGNSTSGTIAYAVSLENIGFNDCIFGIKVDAVGNTHFESILNKFDRCSFITCETGFYCNSVNTAFSFDSCYFSLPAAGTALECAYMGNLAVEHCTFVGNQGNEPHVPATDGTTILKAVGGFNNISFYDCQDENIQFAYQKGGGAYTFVPLVFRSCIIQSKLLFSASGSVIFDSCRIGVSTCSYPGVPKECRVGAVEDTGTAYARVYLKGLNNFYTPTSQVDGKISAFVNPLSRVIYEAKEMNSPEIYSVEEKDTEYTVTATRGIVIIPESESYVVVHSDLLREDSIVLTQLRTYDSGGARIREVQCASTGSAGGYFQINLTQQALTDLEVAFKIESSGQLSL